MFIAMATFPHATRAELAMWTNTTEGTVMESIADLEEAGLVQQTTPGRYAVLLHDREYATLAESATAVTKKYWVKAHPKPIIGFIRVRKIVSDALQAGWTGKQILNSLPQIPVFSEKALEFALRRQYAVKVGTERPTLDACPTCDGAGKVWRHIHSGTLTTKDHSGDSNWGLISCPTPHDDRY